jgi:hypothetical protein
VSGQATALAEAKKLKAIMARHGVQCSIELQVGRPWAGDDWYSRKYVLVNHHTAGSKTGNTPSLALVKRGRGADLPGPLCNGYGGRDFVYRIECMGLANHPGAGGPLTVAGFAIPKDSARISTWGTEWEHDGVSAWDPHMQEFMGRSNAALCEYLGIKPERSIEHKTWAPARKIDRNRYTAATGQQEIRTWAGAVAAANTPKPEDDDVKLTDEIELATPAQVKAFNLNVSDPKKAAKIGDTFDVERALMWGGPGDQRLLYEIRQNRTAITGLQAALKTISAALTQLVAGSSDGVRQAFDDGIAGLKSELAAIEVHVSLGDDQDDDAPDGAQAPRPRRGPPRGGAPPTGCSPTSSGARPSSGACAPAACGWATSWPAPTSCAPRSTPCSADSRAGLWSGG